MGARDQCYSSARGGAFREFRIFVVDCFSAHFFLLRSILVLVIVYAQVVATLAGALLVAKVRLATSDGMLPAAELALSAFSKCPGLLRYARGESRPLRCGWSSDW